MTNPLNAGNKLHSGTVKKEAVDQLGNGALGMPDTSHTVLSGEGSRRGMDSTTD